MGSTQPMPLPPLTGLVHFPGDNDNDYIDAANTDEENVDHLMLLPDEHNSTAIGDNNNEMSLNEAVNANHGRNDDEVNVDAQKDVGYGGNDNNNNKMPFIEQNQVANSNAASNAASKRCGRLRGQRLKEHIATQMHLGTGAKSLIREEQKGNCVPKSPAHISTEVAKQDGTSNYLFFRLTTERQKRSTKEKCGILCSEVEHTLCERLAKKGG